MTTDQDDLDELALLEARLAKIRAEKADIQAAEQARRTREDSRRRVELEAILRRQRNLDLLTMKQAEARRAKAQWEDDNYYWN